jgi:O-antigen/teichoic acid export membrane protein
MTVPMAVAVCIAAPWLLLLFGPSYAQQGAELLRWLAAAAPLAGLAGLYFTRLRVQKRIGSLIALSGIVSALTLGAAVVLTSRMGLAAAGAGFLLGNALVVMIGLVGIWRELAPGHGRP